MDMNKNEKDSAIRAVGFERVNLEGLTQISGNSFVGETEVEGVVRFFEIKVIARAENFDEAKLAEVLAENEATRVRKVEKAEQAEAKKAKDKAKRAKAKEVAEWVKEEEL